MPADGNGNTMHVDETADQNTPTEVGPTEAKQPEAAPPSEETVETPEPDPIDSLKAELDEAREKLLRSLAEADNTRKRAERQIRETRIYAIQALAYDLLPVTDDLDRALVASSPDQHDALLDGVGMVRKTLRAALERHGVMPVEAEVGGIFDPSLHQAVSQIPSDVPKGHLADTYTPGWKIGDRALRAAMVAVSSGESPAEDGTVAGAPPCNPGDIVDTSV